MTTLITHIYNEEFLLPFWIRQHSEKFDDVIVIDFDSTDRSIEIIKELAPSWTVIQSPFQNFDAKLLDEFIMELEKSIRDSKIVLTITEFLIGDPRNVTDLELVIPSTELVCLPGEIIFNVKEAFHEQISTGIPYLARMPSRHIGRGRLLHIDHYQYPLGRHFDYEYGKGLLIYRVASCLVNEEMINRRLQIQNKISSEHKMEGQGSQHHDNGKGLTRATLLDSVSIDRKASVDVCEELTTVLSREKLELMVHQATKQSDRENLQEAIRCLDFLIQERDLAIYKPKEVLSKKKLMLSLVKKFLPVQQKF